MKDMSDFNDFLNNLPEQRSDKPKKKREPLPEHILTRYNAAHKANFAVKYPNAFKDGHYLAPKIPDHTTANGLTTLISDYVTWMGGYANRINVMGRTITTKDTKCAMGVIKGKSVQIKSSTKVGSEDVDLLVNGYSLKLEIKVGKDTHKEAQIKHGEKVKKAGGNYFVVRNPETFFTIYDKIAALPYNGVPVGLFD